MGAFKFDPSRGMVAGLLPATHVSVNSRPLQALGNEGIEEWSRLLMPTLRECTVRRSAGPSGFSYRASTSYQTQRKGLLTLLP
jgi:hypothetical protein